MHDPSVRALKSIGEALNVSAETLFEQAGLTSPAENLDDEATENTIRADQRLSEEAASLPHQLFAGSYGSLSAQKGMSPAECDC